MPKISRADFKICLLTSLEKQAQESVELEIERVVGEARELGEPWASSWTKAAIFSELQRGQTFVALGVAAGAVMGFLCFRPPGPMWEIMLVMTVGPHRGRRVAGALIDSLFSYAAGCEFGNASQQRASAARSSDEQSLAVGLEVRSDNLAAIQCYVSCGFIEQGRRVAYYRDGQDAILMSSRRSAQ